MAITESERRRFEEDQGMGNVIRELEDEIKQLREENDGLRTAIACSADLMNTWARDLGVEECTSPWSGTALRDLVDRLWFAESMVKE